MYFATIIVVCVLAWIPECLAFGYEEAVSARSESNDTLKAVVIPPSEYL
jgi:hypothetical protein